MNTTPSTVEFSGPDKRISGHRTLIMVERYAHQNGEHIQTAMDKLEGRYRLCGVVIRMALGNGTGN